MAFIVKEAYINTHQAPVPKEFANKLVLYNRYLITTIYIISLTIIWITFFTMPSSDGAGFVTLFLLIISAFCFLFYLFILPKIVRFILIKKDH